LCISSGTHGARLGGLASTPTPSRANDSLRPAAEKKNYVGSWLFSWCHSPARLASFRRCFCSKYWEAMGGWGFERNKCTLTAGKRFRIAEEADDDKGWKGVWVLVYSTGSHSLMYIYIDRLVPHLKMIAFPLAHTYICTLRTIPRNIFFTQDSIKQMPDINPDQAAQNKMTACLSNRRTL